MNDTVMFMLNVAMVMATVKVMRLLLSHRSDLQEPLGPQDRHDHNLRGADDRPKEDPHSG
jgi:hypothetical protein